MVEWTMRALLVALTALLLLQPGTGVASSGSPEHQLSRLQAAPVPVRDPVAVATRLRGAEPATAALLPPPQPHCPGERDDFWVVDQGQATMFEVNATLRVVTGPIDASGCGDPEALLPPAGELALTCPACTPSYWYVQDEYASLVSQQDVERSAAVFAERIAPTVRTYFGPSTTTPTGADPYVVFLLGRVPNVAAYYSNVDGYSAAVFPRSNERQMIYVNLDYRGPGSDGFDSTIAHEYQHLVHHGICRGEETWVDEGSAELAMQVAGYGVGGVREFVTAPDIPLTTWSHDDQDVHRNYQASYLFMRYFMDRFGGPDVLPSVLQGCSREGDIFSNFLASQGLEGDFNSLVSDWAVANLVNDRAIADGRYGYARSNFRVTPSLQASIQGPLDVSVPQQAASYVTIPSGARSVEVVGSTVVPLLPAVDPAHPRVWWSNRQDGMNSHLTRLFDLQGLTSATLTFQAWHDLEDDFDFSYLAASTDGGRTWKALQGRTTRTDAALGSGIGHGWTGKSGGGTTARWIDEQVDLSQFAGQQILLRFETLTDQAYSSRGFAFTNLAIPEMGWTDDSAQPYGWVANGWLTVDAPIPQPWSLRLVRWRQGSVTVEAIPVGPDGRAVATLDGTEARAVLVAVPQAPRTLERASLRVEARG